MQSTRHHRGHNSSDSMRAPPQDLEAWGLSCVSWAPGCESTVAAYRVACGGVQFSAASRETERYGTASTPGSSKAAKRATRDAPSIARGRGGPGEDAGDVAGGRAWGGY